MANSCKRLPPRVTDRRRAFLLTIRRINPDHPWTGSIQMVEMTNHRDRKRSKKPRIELTDENLSQSDP